MLFEVQERASPIRSIIGCVRAGDQLWTALLLSEVHKRAIPIRFILCRVLMTNRGLHLLSEVLERVSPFRLDLVVGVGSGLNLVLSVSNHGASWVISKCPRILSKELDIANC